MGDPTKICYRSLWERKFMKYCDDSPNIVQWSSEEIQIPYFSPLDQRYHRYFVDFWIKIREKDGTIKCKLIEIKPHKQTSQPQKPVSPSRRYLKEVKNWIINTNKWEAARAYCQEKEWEFVILTEKHLFKNEK